MPIFLDEKGDPGTIEQVLPNKNAIYSIDGEPLPLDIANKTLLELRNLGFTDIMSFDVKHDPMSNSVKPQIKGEERERLMQLANEYKKDLNDPDFNLELDDDSLYNGLIDEEQSLDRPRNEKERILFARIKKQKQIDDRKIALVYKALEKGIALPEDELYLELLAMYPHY